MACSGHPTVAVAVAVVVAVAAWRRSPIEVVILAVAVGAMTGRRWLAMGVVVLGLAIAARSAAEIDGLAPDRLGPFTGWATVAADPRPFGTATRVVLELDGERFETWLRSRSDRLRVGAWNHGDVVWVAGERVRLESERADRVAWEHVVGEFDSEVLGDRRPGRRFEHAANRVRGLIDSATAPLPHDDAALARGLIIGDDGDQPPAMIERFRASGLSHLTAVSGQNVALALAVVGPLLRRARPVPRLVATLALIGWFVVLTRAEPSVLRAGMMAALAALAFARGAEREPPRLLAVAVVLLLAVDPLLVRSVGFWLSVGATAGVTMLGPPLRRRLAWLGPVATPVAMTVAAQAGVAVPSIVVFGRLPLAGTVANLVAVPVAGFVMLYGLPACLACGAIPMLRSVLMLPVAVGVRWVDTVAWIAARAEPPPPWNAVGWGLLVGGLAAGWYRHRRRDLDGDDRLPQSPSS